MILNKIGAIINAIVYMYIYIYIDSVVNVMTLILASNLSEV